MGTPYPELAAPSRLTLARVWAPYLRFHFGEVARYPWTGVKGVAGIGGHRPSAGQLLKQYSHT